MMTLSDSSRMKLYVPRTLVTDEEVLKVKEGFMDLVLF